MSDISKAFGRAAFDILARELSRCRLGKSSGALHLIGSPGGVFHLRHGAVVGVDSPGAPGADALLLRSGRLSETEWTAALSAGAQARSYQAQPADGERLGPTAWKVLCLMAARDAAFATAAGTVQEYGLAGEPADVLMPLEPGIDPDSLLRETARRLDALAALPVRVSPHRERVAPVPGMGLRERSALVPVRQEILGHANGRRSARDIAFIAGRSVYPVTVEISRMLGEGLVEVVSEGSRAAFFVRGPITPRRRDGEDPGLDAAGVPAVLLPRRSPGASGISGTSAPPGAAPARQATPRLPNHRTGAAPSAAPMSQEPQCAWEQKGNVREP